MSDVSAWLANLGLAQYATAFADNDVDFEALSLLDVKDLVELGVSLGHRKKLLRAIAELSGAPASANLALPSNAETADRRETLNGERRQITVLFCDLVGSTALSARLDPEDFRAVIRAYQDCIENAIAPYDGYLAQYLGDGVLMYFGYPNAHEDDAHRALRAALDISSYVRAMQIPTVAAQLTKLAVRIGVHTGLVVVGEQGRTADSSLALGETPNIAARLQALAAPNQVVISDHTKRLAGGGFECVDLGVNELKGALAPIRAWAVTGAAHASRFEAATQGTLTTLVGREHEIAMLHERWQLAQAGEGQVVLLSGEAGIGKSRIANAVVERLAAQDVHLVRLQCSPYRTESALHPTIENFARALKFTRDDTAESRLDKLEEMLLTRFGLPLADMRFIADLLSLPAERRYGTSVLTPAKAKEETIRVLLDLTTLAALKRATVMLFEDAHWADPTSLELLEHLIDRMRSLPLMLVVTHRPQFDARWTAYGHITALALSKLTRAQSSAIVAKLTQDKPLPAALTKEILAKTDGIPLFVEELTKAVLESGELLDAGDHYEYAGQVRYIRVPATLRDSLTARFDSAGATKEIAQIGAALGREFSYELIAAVAGKPPVELDQALQGLCDLGLAFRRGTPPEATYIFKHALVQDAAYDSLLKARRQALHGTIANVLISRFPLTAEREPELLAHHLTEAGHYELAIDYWQKAGEQAMQRSANREAIGHLERSTALISELPPSPGTARQELTLHITLGTVLIAANGWASEDVAKAYNRAQVLCTELGETTQLAAALFGQWMNDAVAGRLDQSLEIGARLLQLAEGTVDRTMQFGAHYALGGSNFWRGDFSVAQMHLDRCVELYERERHLNYVQNFGNDMGILGVVYAAQCHWCQGFPGRALYMLNDNLRLARQLEHPYSAMWLSLWSSAGYQLLRDRETANRLITDGLQRCEAHGFRMESALGMILAGWARFGQTPEEALQQSMEGHANWLATGAKLGCTWWASQIAEMQMALGRFDAAAQTLTDGLATARETGETMLLAEIYRGQGELVLARGAAQSPEPYFLQALELTRAQGAKSLELRAVMSLARLWQGQGRPGEAYNLLSEIYGWFTEGFETRDLMEAKTLLEKFQASA